ncbi:MAG: CocE/NonD family hydrolase [Pirellulaceae bacterium]|nr:CocE/NonD family hydrolase [Pirellulaceae bacterium]
MSGSLLVRRPVCTIWLFCVICWLNVSGPAVVAQELVSPESSIRLRYVKQEVMIAMRDGVRLHTAIYSPRDTTQTYPLLLKRTPYSCDPYGAHAYPSQLGPSRHFTDAGYIFVVQDVRGQYMSEGTFVQVTPHIADKRSPQQIDESSDTFDTIQWLLQNVQNHNGRVGMYGISYPGFYCSAGMIDAHPALRAVSPQAPVADWYFDDFLHNGAFFLAHAYRWLGYNAQPRTGPTSQRPSEQPLPSLDGYNLFLQAGTIQEINRRFLKGSIPFWDQMMQHPNRDQFWKQRDIVPHLKNVAPAVLLVTGWFDAEDLYGSFATYQAIERHNPSVNNVLVVGPWRHGGWASEEGDRLGDAHFGSKTAAFYRAEIEFPFFEMYLKDADFPPPAEATVFETGSNRWRVFDTWPPAEAKDRKLFFQQAGLLDDAPPTQPADYPHDYQTDAPARAAAYDQYVSDPSRPVPYTAAITPRMTNEYMVEDQRFAARRPDVLAYQTPVLQQDVTVAGPIDVQLWVTTTGTDADFIVKLIDVFPDGTQVAQQPNYHMLVRSEVFRARFRESFEHPQPLQPGQPTRIAFQLQDVLHRFQVGHQIMVQVQSSWFPLVDRNPQKYIPNIFFAEADDFQTATHRLLRSAEHPSHLRLSVLP